jgi:AraC family transcriptional regulator, transcriptional activator of pobA
VPTTAGVEPCASKRRGRRDPAPEITIVEFDRNKYSRRLLVDAAPFHALTDFITTQHPHRLRFHEILFLTGGSGSVDLDGVSTEVRPCRVCFTAPGEIRRWRLDKAPQGCAVLFDEDFIRGFFSEASLQDELLFFGYGGDCRFLDVAGEEFTRLMAIVDAMHRELRAPRDVSDHILRALLYQLLVEVGQHRPTSRNDHSASGGALHARFRSLVNLHFRSLRQVAQYADALHVTASHLNQAVRSATGATASDAIHGRLFLESRRLLLHTRQNVAAVALDLGFREPSYFNRFFKRMAGMTPRAFRLQGKSAAFSTKSDLKANGD